MAGADDTAILKILVEIAEARKSLDDLARVYQGTIEKLQAATEAGLDPSTKEFEELRQAALAAGQQVLAAGELGAKGMAELAAAQGRPAEGQEQLLAQLKELRQQLLVLEVAGPSAMNKYGQSAEQAAANVRRVRTESEGGSEGVDLLSSSFEKGSAKIGNFVKGIAGGIVVGELLLPVVNLLTEGLIKGAKAFADYQIQQLAGGESTTKLGEKTRSLESSLGALTERTREARKEEAEAESKRTGYLVTVEKMVEAEKARNDALADAEEQYKKETAAARSSGDLLDAREKKLRATETAQRDYNDAISGERAALEAEVEAGKRFAAGINAEQDALHAEESALVGDKKALEEHTATLLKAIAEVEEHGEVNKKNTAVIKASLQENADDYKKWGLPIPELLQAVIDKYRLLGDTHTETAKKLAVPIQPPGAAADDAGLKSLAGRRDELKKTIDDLNRQQLEGGLDADAFSKLTAAQDELAGVQQELHNKTLDTTKAIEAQAAAVADTRSDFEKGQDVLSRYGATLDGATDHYDALTARNEEFAKSLVEGQQDVSDWAQEMKDAGLSVEMLAERQEAAWATVKDGAINISNLTDEQKKNLAAGIEWTGQVKKNTEAWKGFADRLKADVKELNGEGDSGLGKTLILIGEIGKAAKGLDGVL